MIRVGNKLYIALICAGLALTTFVAFEQVRHNDFVNYDDNIYVTDNTLVQAGITVKSVIYAFTSIHSVSNWQPLTLLSHMIDCQLFGVNPFWHHLTSLLIHIVNTILLFCILQKMTGAIWRSAFVAAVFALHPLHVESVAWVAERKDVLSGLFWMLTLAAYLRYIKRPGFRTYLLVCLTLSLGLMAKPMLVTLPFVLLLLDYWPLCRFRWAQQINEQDLPDCEPVGPICYGTSTWRLIAEKIPLFALVIISSVIAFIAQQSSGAVIPAEKLPAQLRVANAVVSYVNYVAKMIYPVRLAVFYPHPANSLTMWQPIAYFLILAVVSTIVICMARRRRYFVVGWLWYLGTLVPVIGLVQIGGQAMADRYTYIPSIGFFIMVAWAAVDFLANSRFQKIKLGILSGLALFILILCTRAQVRYWQNDFTLFGHAARINRDNYIAYNGLGIALQSEGKLGEAISHFRQALKVNPAFVEAHSNLGVAMLEQGQPDRAFVHFCRARKLKSDFVDALNNLAWVVAAYPEKEFHNPAEAVHLAETACELTEFNRAELLDTLSVAYGSVGRFDEAIKTAEKAIIVAEAANQQQLAEQIRNHLDLFKRGVPYYDSAQPDKKQGP